MHLESLSSLFLTICIKIINLFDKKIHKNILKNNFFLLEMHKIKFLDPENPYFDTKFISIALL